MQKDMTPSFLLCFNFVKQVLFPKHFGEYLDSKLDFAEHLANKIIDLLCQLENTSVEHH